MLLEVKNELFEVLFGTKLAFYLFILIDLTLNMQLDVF